MSEWLGKLEESIVARSANIGCVYDFPAEMSNSQIIASNKSYLFYLECRVSSQAYQATVLYGPVRKPCEEAGRLLPNPLQPTQRLAQGIVRLYWHIAREDLSLHRRGRLSYHCRREE
jgi:hypothetical protein